MAPVPAGPFTFSQLLRSQYLLLLLLLVLGLPTGTVNVPILLSSLALCNRLDSRAEPLFTTFVFTHTTATHYRVHFAASMRNFAIAMTSILDKSPSSVYPPLGSNRVPGCPGGSQMAGGSRESHLTIKQKRTNVSVLPLLLTHSLSHTHSINWTDSFGSICSIYRWLLVLFTVVPAIAVWFTGKMLTFAFTSFIRRADDSSGKILSFRGLRAQPRYKRMAEKEPTTLDGLHGCNFTHPLYLLPLPRFWISIFGIELGHFMPFTSWISIFGIELRLSLPCLDWMSTGFA